MDNLKKVIPIVSTDEEADISFASAKRNFSEILARAPWLSSLDKEVLPMVKENASQKTKYRKMVAIADRMAEAISPFAACKKGCSHCCYKSVAISEFEAERLKEVTGRPFKGVVRPRAPAAVSEVEPSEACPFLEDGQCSIYENRPIACRLSFNVSNDNFFCDPERAPIDSQAPTLRMDAFWMGYAMLFVKQPLADIRDFFASDSNG